MSATTVPDTGVVEEAPKPRRELRVPHGGWRVIAAKELGDDLLSRRRHPPARLPGRRQLQGLQFGGMLACPHAKRPLPGQPRPLPQ